MSASTPLDPTDRRILDLLQTNARIANAEIAREVGMAPSAVLERVKKLEQKGILAGYEARLVPKKLGLGLTAFVFVRAEERGGTARVGARLAALALVQEVHQVAGEDCYFVKLRAKDTEGLAELLGTIKAIPGITSTRTTIVLGTVKESARLPVPASDEETP